MKKVLIVTLFGNYNYGNKFQNYAMQEVLKKYQLDVCTLDTQKIFQSTYEKVSFVKRLKNLSIKNVIKKLNDIRNRTINTKRTLGFINFSNKYIKMNEYISDEKLKKEFDFVCIGSDQVWKPEALNSHYAYAHFHDSNNVFAYAPSFGISNIADEYVEKLKNGLKNVKNISVREQRGAEIVKEISGRDAEVVVDPTMLLTTEEWDSIIMKPAEIPEKEFIVTYFLGNYSKKRRKYIKKFAKKNNLVIVDLGQVDYKKYYCSDPGEFLYFIKHAKIIFTDSFHGTVFSILYRKPFYAMNREDDLLSMSSRIETLLNKFDLKERIINNYNQEINFEIDFKNIDESLKFEREKSDKYLKKALNADNVKTF